MNTPESEQFMTIDQVLQRDMMVHGTAPEYPYYGLVYSSNMA